MTEEVGKEMDSGIMKIANGNHLYKSDTGNHIDISVHHISGITYSQWHKGSVGDRVYWHREMNMIGKDGIHTQINLFSHINPKDHNKEI